MAGKVTANQEIKRINRTNIYHCIRTNKAVSCKDIQKVLELSLPTIYQNLEELIDEGLVREFGDVGNTGGRRARTFSVVDDARVAIGLSLTKDKVTAIVVDLAGKMLHCLEKYRNFQRTKEYFIFLSEMVQEVLENSGIEKERVLGVDIGVPCLTDAENYSITYGRIIQLTGATADEVGEYIPFPVRLIHDVYAAGFAEQWLNKDLNHAFYLLLSQTVGGAVFVGGKPYYGDFMRGGEVGHLILYPDGKQCYCGNKGCADLYLSTNALLDGRHADLEGFFQALDCHDLQAVNKFELYVHDLALVLRSIQLTMDCTIVLGGEIGKYIGKYIWKIREALKQCYPFEINKESVTACKCQSHSISIGAALYSIQEYLDTI